MIKQHFFTNTDKGLFKKEQGMDTIAKSRGLADDLILSTLQAHCVYKPPNKLEEYLEDNKELYPPALSAYWTDAGELVVNRTVFVPTDSPEKNAFFSHDFIVPVKKSLDMLPELKNILYITDFREQYDNTFESHLPEIDSFHYDLAKCGLNDTDTTLLEYGINEAVFKMILTTLLEAIEKNKKMYLALNIKTSKLYI